ncbi:MAG: hypothetical protein V3V08_05370 [Nannocystaceae bacterium]
MPDVTEEQAAAIVKAFEDHDCDTFDDLNEARLSPNWLKGLRARGWCVPWDLSK